MPLLLRITRRAKWYKNPNVPWLPAGELQADALGDLNTKVNELSVWYIDEDRTNFERVISALAAKRDVAANFDYALIDSEEISDLNLKMVQTPGDSLDEEANKSWHRDIRELTASLLFELARAIRAKGEIDRIDWKDVGAWLGDSISDGKIDENQLKEGVRLKLQDLS